MEIKAFQAMIEDLYGARDKARGQAATFQWFVEEIGELAQALRKGSRENVEEEFADVLAWLTTLASMNDIDLEKAASKKYPGFCIRCKNIPCSCP